MKIQTQKVYVVREYENKVETAEAIQIPSILDGLMEYRRKWLVFVNSDTIRITDENDICRSAEAAAGELRLRRRKRIALYKSRIENYEKEIAELEK